MSPKRTVIGWRSSSVGVCVAIALSARFLAPAPIQAGRAAGIQGAGNSEVWIQNRDPSQSATVVMDLFNQKGGPPVSIARANVPSGAAANIYLPEEPFLTNSSYAAIASADRPIGTVLRSDWSASGAAVMMNDSLPGTDIIVPFLAKGYQGGDSLLSIQNTDVTAPVPVTIEVYAAGETEPLATAAKFIGPGTSITVDLEKDPTVLNLPMDTVGYARIRAENPIAVQSIVDIQNSLKAAFGFEGVPLALAAETLFAPLVHAGAFVDPHETVGPLDSFISVVNPGSAPVKVTVRYTGIAGSCQAKTYSHPPFTLAGHASALVAQAPGQALPGTGASPLPAGCTAAAAIEATGGSIIATVVDRDQFAAQAYTALAPVQGSPNLLLPVIRRSVGDTHIISGIHVMNLGSRATTATISFRDSAGQIIENCAGCSVSLPAGGGHLWLTDAIAAIPMGMLGSASVSADQPLGVVVNEYDIDLLLDMSSYLGIAQSASAGGNGSGPERRYAPLLLKQGEGSTPRPTRTPAASRTEPPPAETSTPMSPVTETPIGPAPTSQATAPSVPTANTTRTAGTPTGTPPVTPSPVWEGFYFPSLVKGP